MTALERAARAIYEARNGYGCKAWAHQPKEYREPYMADARAVLQAIRESDFDTSAAGCTATHKAAGPFLKKLNDEEPDNPRMWAAASTIAGYGKLADDAWRAMIDHILEGE